MSTYTGDDADNDFYGEMSIGTPPSWLAETTPGSAVISPTSSPEATATIPCTAGMVATSSTVTAAMIISTAEMAPTFSMPTRPRAHLKSSLEPADEIAAELERCFQAGGEQGGGIVGDDLLGLDSFLERGAEHPSDEIAPGVRNPPNSNSVVRSPTSSMLGQRRSFLSRG